MNSLDIYSVPKGEELVKDFEMQVEGKEVPLHYARVSAYPINRRWPGHQRPLEQTELASFASFSITRSVNVTLTSTKEFKEVVIRPLSKKITPKVEGQKITFTLPKSGQYTVELDGPHNALHIFADEQKDFNVNFNNPKLRYFGPGLHEVGNIILHDDEILFIDAGAIVFGQVLAQNANNIKIIGHGILDGSKNKEVYLHQFNEEDKARRDKGFAVLNVKRFDTIRLIKCDNVLIEGITLRDSLLYTIRPICCNNLTINNVKIIGNWRYNSDGIDMHNCCDVNISNCFIRTFDDCICVKGFDYVLPPEQMQNSNDLRDRACRIKVENCVLWCDWNTTLEIGAETRAEEIAYITFNNCDIIHNFSAACDITSVDYAYIHDIVYNDIRVEESPTQMRILQTSDNQTFEDIPNPPVYGCVLRCVVQRHPEYSGNDPRSSVVKNVTFSNISLSGRMMACYFVGSDKDHVSGPIKIENFRCNGKHLTNSEDLRLWVDSFIEDVTIC